MVYLALGVLAVTLSISLYQYRVLRNTPDFLRWRRKDSTATSDIKSLDIGNGKSEDDEEPRDDLPAFAIQDGEREPTSFVAFKRKDSDPTAEPTLKSNGQTQAESQIERAKMPPPVRKIPKVQKEQTLKQPAQTAMQPPSRPTQTTSTFKVPPKPSSTLRPPPSTASTLRAPPSSSLKPSTSSLAPSTSTLSPSSRPSKKVILEPGHSPLDWAHLTANPPTPTFLRGTDVPPDLIRVPPSAVRYHSGRMGKDAWGVYQGKVYNMSPYMKFHPGGVEQLMRGAGKEREGERLFNEIHPWVSWENMLGECLVGILVSENEVEGGKGDGLEDMD